MKTRFSLALSAAGIVALAGCGSSSNDTSTTSTTSAQAPVSTPAHTAAFASTAKVNGPITVDLSEWAVKTSTATAPAGKVQFDIHNAGKIPHEMVVLKTTAKADALGTGSRIPETGHVGEVGDVAAGARKHLTLKLAPGHYSLVCNLPGHYMSGMHTDLTVQ
ncbi:MAG: hypothetical protein QOF76_4122 [Solirubrobacteraceae bacterium]|jgi:uncharacterized cupredoxin-like copper-binding protein|nr:hypothetical protein [Solirubrobacteraceae bacterium]